jgi:hypothetical protein
MPRVVSVLSWLTIVVAPAAYGAAAQRPFIECDADELRRAVPELADVKFDASQDSLDGLLHAAGENLANMFAGLVNISAAEEINELRFDQNMGGTNRREAFRYAVKLLPPGTAFQNSNNILTGLQRAFADGRQYYMLAYVPSNSDPDGKFRPISVRLRDGKMVVKAKRGYWALPN